MLLAVDVDNKNISFAVFDDLSAEPVAKFKMASDIRKTSDEYAVTVSQLLGFSGIDARAVEGVIMASVVPQLNETVRAAVLCLTDKTPLIVGPGVKTGFAIKIDDPATLGADIVANSAAAVAILKEEKNSSPAIILDMGAVTTLFAVNRAREVVGGAILPGVDMSLSALHRETAQLPNIELSGAERAIGKNTKEALISGTLIGQAAMIDGLVDRFEKELKCNSGEAELFATGEYAEPVTANCSHTFRLNQDLTLKGLACIYKNTVK